MRRFLLNSTALLSFLILSVSASLTARAAEITITGDAEVNVTTDSGSSSSDGSKIGSETDISISFTETTDSGLVLSAAYGFDESGSADDINYSVSGDFGLFSVSTAYKDDGAVDALDIEADMVAENSDFAGHTQNYGDKYAGEWVAGQAGADQISYTLPSLIEGLKVALQYSNEAGGQNGGESFASGLNYSIGNFKFAYAMTKLDNPAETDAAGMVTEENQHVDVTHIGLSATFSGVTFEYAQNQFENVTKEDPNKGDEGTGTRLGLSYTFNDITLGYESVNAEYDDTTTTDKAADSYKYSAVGAEYSIAPGLTARVALTDATIGNGADKQSYDVTKIALDVAF